jgi:hypothetical protein
LASKINAPKREEPKTPVIGAAPDPDPYKLEGVTRGADGRRLDRNHRCQPRRIAQGAATPGDDTVNIPIFLWILWVFVLPVVIAFYAVTLTRKRGRSGNWIFPVLLVYMLLWPTLSPLGGLLSPIGPVLMVLLVTSMPPRLVGARP